jgi:hypothetical protein
MASVRAPRIGRRAAAITVASILLLQGPAAANDDGSGETEIATKTALILDDAGVVINAAVYHPVTSVSWLEQMRERGVHVIIREENDVAIGSVLQPDGSFARDVPLPPPPVLPTPSEDDAQGSGWAHQSGPQEPYRPQIADDAKRRFLGVPGPEDGVNRIALHIGPDGVVTNASVYNTVTSVEWFRRARERGEHIIIADRGGIGWSVLPDGTVAPPMPRAGMVWNGTEWRAPGTESVERPTDVRGWALDRFESTVPLPADPDTAPGEAPVITDEWAGVHGRILVPEDAADDESTLADIAERSIVMLESYGETVRFLARFDGLAQLRDRLESELDAAVAAAEATGAPVDEDAADRFRGAARRLAASFLGFFGMDTTALIRGTA